MSGLTLLLLVLSSAGMLLLPRRWAALPLLTVTCYVPATEALEIAGFNFYPLRVVLALAMLRVLLRGEGPAGGVNGLDRAMLWWALAALATSPLHEDPSATLVNRLGLVYTSCGAYFVLRMLVRDLEDVRRVCLMLALLLPPLALEMLREVLTGENLFAAMGGVDAMSEVRDGRVRAQGPFSHPILAGTAGAAALPLAAALWRRHKLVAMLGMAAGLTMVLSSRSSGPILSALAAVAALLLWRARAHMRSMRWLLVSAYLGLAVVMNAPAYYVITRIDLTGSSTSWHRAALIEAALTNLSDWWLAGTDYTRHWMAYGVGWSGNHIDVTNYYLRMGVDGGLPLLLTFVLVLARGFSLAGQSWRRLEALAAPGETRFLPWALGAALLAHATAFISVAYFDQSVVFLYLTLAGIAASFGAAPAPAQPPASSRPVARTMAWHVAGRRGLRPRGSP